jgi:hypothetical protein
MLRLIERIGSERFLRIVVVFKSHTLHPGCVSNRKFHETVELFENQVATKTLSSALRILPSGGIPEGGSTKKEKFKP